MAIKSKGWWESSTVWINLAGIAVIVLDLIVKTNLIPDADVVTIILAIINILRRFQAPKIIEPIRFN